jgi:hypothetical protein
MSGDLLTVYDGINELPIKLIASLYINIETRFYEHRHVIRKKKKIVSGPDHVREKRL